MKLRYWIALVIGIIVVTSAFIYILTPVGDVEQDGIPNATIIMELTKIDPDTNTIVDEVSVEWELFDNNDIPTPISSKDYAFTVTTVGIPFVEPNHQYIIDWFIDVLVIPQSPSVTDIDVHLDLYGFTPPGSIPGEPGLFPNGIGQYWDSGNIPLELDQVAQAGVEESFSFEWATGPPAVTVIGAYDGGSNHKAILGSYLHDSTFWVNISAVAQIDPTIFGVLAQEILLQVGAGGTLDVSIVSIGASTTDSSP